MEIVTSVIIFFMYMMLQLIDLNVYAKSLEIQDPSKTTRSSFVYAYLASYYLFFLKLTLQLLTLVVLVTIVFWGLIGMTAMLKNKKASEFNSAESIKKMAGDDLGEKMWKSAEKVARHIMGLYFLPNFFMIYIIIIPLFLLFFLLMFAQFYNRTNVRTKDKANSKSIMATYHNYVMLVITALVVFGVLYFILSTALQLIE